MQFDYDVKLLLQQQINTIIKYYHIASPTASQKELLKKELLILKKVLYYTQYHLKKTCQKEGHLYTPWIIKENSSYSSKQSKVNKYKLVRTCLICNYAEEKKHQFLLINRHPLFRE